MIERYNIPKVGKGFLREELKNNNDPKNITSCTFYKQCGSIKNGN